MAESKPTTTTPPARPGLRTVEEAMAAETPKPTPTQDENDRAKMGEDVATKEDDGSGPDPTAPPTAGDLRVAPKDKAAPQHASRPATPPPPRSQS
jgi:hypothetical protein